MMIYPFWAPPAFFESTYVPHICLIYGTRDDIVFRPVPLRGAFLFDMPTVPLPMSPRACRSRSPWRDVWLVLALALWCYVLVRVVGFLVPRQTVWSWLLVLSGVVLLPLWVYLRYLRRVRWRRPNIDWVEVNGEQQVRIVFPRGWETVYLEFERALAAWRLRPPDQVAAPPPPPDEFTAETAPVDDLPDGESNDWDEAKNK